MVNLTKTLGLNVCCSRKFIRNKCSNIITGVNIGILYYVGLEIFQYSYNFGYNFTNSILYMEDRLLVKAILTTYRLMGLLLAICFWVAFSETWLTKIDCKCRS